MYTFDPRHAWSRVLRASVTVALLVCTAAAFAAGPMEEIKAVTDKVLNDLNDPAVQGDAKKAERIRRVRTVVSPHFAWEESAKACLGKHWRNRTPAERTEFTKLFSGFLQDTYAEKLAVYYGNLDRTDYKTEKILDGNEAALVRVVIVTKKKVEHPVEYRMKHIGGRWQIYDALIEGVSMVKNYRDQFDAIIAKSGFDGLLKELRARK